MPRTFRLKSKDSIYHIICKSITEIDLFKDSHDKTKYLILVKKYKLIYNFKLFGYCLMDNHLHLIIGANGADISKIMHGINFSYAMYFNKKYERGGHLFRDRFKSLIVHNDTYLKTLSLYVHNNSTDIVNYKNCPEAYSFSSLGIFLGKRLDALKIVDYGYIMNLFGDTIKGARKNYYDLIFRCNVEKLKEEMEFEDEKTDYRSEKNILIRNFRPENILEFIGLKMNISTTHLHIKYSRKLVHAKALAVVLMRSLCDFKSSDICTILGNITQSRVSKLSTIGISLMDSDEKYKNIIKDFLECYA